jgi:DNA-binding transcriptional MerR regulator
MTNRAALIRELRARGVTSLAEIRAACIAADKDPPTKQAVYEALKPLSKNKNGRPRTKIHMVDTIRELLAAYGKARSRVTITERMRNALNVLEAQVEEYDAKENVRKSDKLKL